MRRTLTIGLATLLLGAALGPVLAAGRQRNGGGSGQCDGSGTAGELTAAETKWLLSMREEEKLARDVYLALADQWRVPVFTNIAASESRHMDAVGSLIDKYGLDDPVTDDTPGTFTAPEFAELYGRLVEAGSASPLAAYKVGALIEEMDIADLRVALAETERSDITNVYENLMRGSRNHLRAFASLIAAAGGTYEAQYLPQEDLDAIAASATERGPKSGGRRRGRMPR